jgi:hypothetical protein
MSDLDNFERSFRGGSSGCLRQCNCGVVYYDVVNSYDWEEGELERLQKDPTAKPLEHSCGDIVFEGRSYVDGCDCWHNRAVTIMTFLDSHQGKIAEYFKLEKARKLKEAGEVPEIEG